MSNGFVKSKNTENPAKGQESPGGRESVSSHRRGLLEGLYTVRTRQLELKPREYGPKEVRAVRMKLKAGQALLARFMGVNTQTISSWEQ